MNLVHNSNEYFYLFVEVEETLGAVDIVKRREGLNGAIYCHGVQTQRPARGHQHPVRRRSTDEHLTNRLTNLILPSAYKFTVNSYVT